MRLRVSVRFTCRLLVVVACFCSFVAQAKPRVIQPKDDRVLTAYYTPLSAGDDALRNAAATLSELVYHHVDPTGKTWNNGRPFHSGHAYFVFMKDKVYPNAYEELTAETRIPIKPLKFYNETITDEAYVTRVSYYRNVFFDADYERNLAASELSKYVWGRIDKDGSTWNNGVPFKDGWSYLEYMKRWVDRDTYGRLIPPGKSLPSPVKPLTSWKKADILIKVFIFLFCFVPLLILLMLAIKKWDKAQAKKAEEENVQQNSTPQPEPVFTMIPSTPETVSNEQSAFAMMDIPVWCRWAVEQIQACGAAREKTPENKQFFDKALQVYTDIQKTQSNQTFRLGVFLSYWRVRLRDRNCPERVRGYATGREIDDALAPLLPGYDEVVEKGDLPEVLACLVCSTGMKKDFQSYYEQVQAEINAAALRRGETPPSDFGKPSPAFEWGIHFFAAFLIAFLVFLALLPLGYLASECMHSWSSNRLRDDVALSIMASFSGPIVFGLFLLPFVFASNKKEIIAACKGIKIICWAIVSLACLCFFINLCAAYPSRAGAGLGAICFRLLTVWMGIGMVYKLGRLFERNSDKTYKGNLITEGFMYAILVFLASIPVALFAVFGGALFS